MNGNVMADRNAGFSDTSLLPPERKQVRGVVYREGVRLEQEERRAWLLQGASIWVKWLLGLPIAGVALWTALLQMWKWFH